MLLTLSEAERMAIASSHDRRRAAWIICDDVVALGDLCDTVSAAGLRSTRELTVAEAEHELRRVPDGTLLIVALADVPVPGEGALLARIDALAAWRGNSAVVCFGRAALDRVAAQLSAPFVTLLCEASAMERVAGIGFADAQGAPVLQEIDAVRDTLRLQQIADEVGRIARALAGAVEAPPRTVSDGLIGYRAEPAEFRTLPAATVRAEDVRVMIRLRRQRDRLFPTDLFADPAWDMMLDLMVARIERLKVAVSSLCIAAAVPPTTALRWIRTLTDVGIFVRVADPTDGRRIFIELSDAAAAKILDFLGEAKRAGGALV